MLSRRRFLQTTSLLSLSPVLPTLLANTARAAAAAPDQRVLVVIQLDGGNDGLNTVVPYADDAYGRARVKLRLEAAKLHKLDDCVALHSSMRAAKDLFDDGRLSIVQNVGYPNPDRSHFRSMAIWQTARCDAEQQAGYGWLGSALDQTIVQRGAAAPANAIFIGEHETPVALWGRRSAATSLSKAEDLRLALDAKPPAAAGTEPQSSLEEFVSTQTLSAYAAADEFRRQQSRPGRGKQLSQYIVGHASQAGFAIAQKRRPIPAFTTRSKGATTRIRPSFMPIGRLLDEFAGATKAFLDDLKDAGLDDRVVVLAFSEFGRRVAENDSQGTDHGTAGPVFVAGSAVRGGLVGNAPDLANLDGGDLKMQIDFRQVYAALLDGWLAIDSKEILGASFDKPAILTL